MATKTRRHPQVTVLHGIPYKVYDRMVKLSANRHLRMSYHDGTLEIVSPHLIKHEVPSRWISTIVTTVADHLNLAYHGTGSYTYRRGGAGPYKGKGKEPDQSYYIAKAGQIRIDRDPDLDAGDPPPDLWIEVDNRVSSSGRLPVYAALGVPEVWQYRSRKKTLRFLRLVEGAYEPVDRSLALPVLTPELVLEALALGENMIESEWVRLLRDWAARTFPRPAGPA
jgi:Uma2 family endonuclease